MILSIKTYEFYNATAAWISPVRGAEGIEYTIQDMFVPVFRSMLCSYQ